MAYDFLFLDGEPVLSEISYTYVASMIAACPGYWTPELKWVEGSFYPQDLILEDFLSELGQQQSFHANTRHRDGTYRDL